MTRSSSASSSPRITEALPLRSSKVSVIGPTLVFKGELEADEDLVIEGQVEGTIAHHKKRLTVGKLGRVKADIDARSSSASSTPFVRRDRSRHDREWPKHVATRSIWSILDDIHVVSFRSRMRKATWRYSRSQMRTKA